MPGADTRRQIPLPVEDVVAQVRKLMDRIYREDQGFGSITLIITPGKVDVKQDSTLRFGSTN
jgi:hypothetical protein